MLALRERVLQSIGSVYGPYRKRGESFLRIEGTALAKSEARVSLEALQAGHEIDGFFSVRLTEDRLQLDVPANAKLMVSRFMGWKTAFDGGIVQMSSSQRVELHVARDELVRLESGKKQWTFVLSEDWSVPAKSIGNGWFNIRGLLNGIKSLSQSVFTHALLALLIAYFGNQFQLPWLSKQNDAKEQAAQEPVKSVPVEVLVASAEGDFSGKGISVLSPEEAAKVAEAKAQKIAGGISALVSKISKISLTQIGAPTTKMAGRDQQANAAVNSIASRIGEMRKSDLKGNFQAIGSGNVGKSSYWDVYGQAGKSFSSKDLDEVAELFRSLQEQFRGCYETALLKYENLSVTVQYEAEVGESGRLGAPAFSTTGNSNPESEAILQGCLSKVLGSAKFKKSLGGARIRNQFIFKS
jgi:hypothetical protein